MRAKEILILAAITAVLAILVFSMMPQEAPNVSLNMRKVNEIVKTIAENWDDLRDDFYYKNGILPFGNEIDYVVIANGGSLVAATRSGLNEQFNDAVRNRDTLVDVIVGGETVGKVVFHNDTARVMEQNRQHNNFTLAIICMFLIFALAGYTFYLHFTLLRPFEKMQGFARRIAAGNLDIPLEMDRNNLFGAFTESFDLMREELHKARENEREADRCKKELVASLSHDIKTPVASIKSATELMLFTINNEEYREQLEEINAKAEQINSLITDMFHATLEELKKLSVSVAEIGSDVIPNLIRYADYEKRVRPFEIPGCLISADSLRLQQVFDNIISNSYKYAGTDIEVRAFIEEQYLIMDITDHGPGVPDDELPFLTQKFYRGKEASKNTSIKSGYGLGLYICKYLMEQMSGGIICENCQDGFTVRLMLRLTV